MPTNGLTVNFDQAYADHSGKILAYLRRLTRDPHLAEELVQETFIRVSQGLNNFRGQARLSTWIYRIATNVYLDSYRKSKARFPNMQPFASSSLPVESSDPAEPSEPRLADRLFEQSEMGECVRGFVDSLPPEYQSVIVLHDLQGLKNAEISQILDCSLGTVKIRIHRARQRLKALLSRHCDFEYSEENVLSCDRKQPSNRGQS